MSLSSSSSAAAVYSASSPPPLAATAAALGFQCLEFVGCVILNTTNQKSF
jgi:hypothetical protein